MAVNVDPGEGEGEIIENSTVVTVTGGLLTSLEGGKVGGSDETSVSGNDEISVSGSDEISVNGNDEISVGGNDEMSVSLKDGVLVGGKEETSVGGRDERSVVGGLGVDEDPEPDKGGRDVKDVGKEVEMVVPVGVEAENIVSSEEEDSGRVKENWVELEIVMEDEGSVTEGGVEDDMLESDGETLGLELEGCDDEELLDSSEDVGEVVGRLLDRLEDELDSIGGVVVGVKEGEDVELEKPDESVEVDSGSLLEKTTTEGKELVRSESVGVGVVVDCEIDEDSVLMEVEEVRLDLRSSLGCEEVEGSIVLEVTLGRELVDVGLSDVELGVLDVDGGS